MQSIQGHSLETLYTSVTMAINVITATAAITVIITTMVRRAITVFGVKISHIGFSSYDNYKDKGKNRNHNKY